MKTILTVEDDTDIGALLVTVISQETPYQSFLAADGFQALNLIRNIHPDLLLLDYSLPGMNGLELYDKLHAMQGLETVPCIMISANLPTREIKKRPIIGLSKPLELDELLGMITQMLD